jgi:heavy metal sensor kinase
MRERRAELERLAVFLIAAGGIMLTIGLVGAWFIAKRAIRPIELITATAESISIEDLARRIDIESTQSELGKLAMVLNSMFDRLERAFERQAKFTADASHELRTPVAVVLAQTTRARRKKRSSAEYERIIDACHVAAIRMKSLVNGLLMLARIDAGSFALESSEVDLTEVVEECLELLQPLATEREVSIQKELEAVKTKGDAERLAQVVSNLITNAIRYNRPGGNVCVGLRAQEDRVVLTVEDTGTGIAAEYVPRVFDRFFRVDSARSRSDGGSGLGLAITRAIVEAHGGTITCTSQLGKGSLFEVRLNGAVTEQPAAPVRAES